VTTTGYVKPPWAARVIGTRMARLFKPAVVSMLSVPGRRTGQWHSSAVAVLSHDGQDFLLSAYGNTEWSRNLRAAGTARLSRHGRTEDIEVEEVPAEQIPPLMEQYLRQFGKMPNVAKTFAMLPTPGDHPTFRITRAANGSDPR
jgi:deazaflavin-dependent oxidoreductase (nitroreductase family)